MTSFDTLLQDLGQADSSLMATPLGDAGALGAILHKRATILQQATQMLDSLRQATPEQKIAFTRSHQAGSQALRQLILAKHMLSSELSQLKREQRLWDTIAGQLPPEPSPTSSSLNLLG